MGQDRTFHGVLTACGLALAAAAAPSAADTASGCEGDFFAMSVEEGLALKAPDVFAYRAAIFFDRVTVTMIDRALGETPPGAAMRADALFVGRDTRWRLTRPVPLIDDPDALVVDPTQTQYLIQPQPDAAYVALVLVGLAANGAVERPALAGRLSPPDGRMFTIEPVGPAECRIAPVTAASWAHEIIERNTTLKRK